MQIIFNKNNSFTIVSKDGKVICNQELKTFDVSNLKDFGLSEFEQNKIKLMLEQRKYNFYA